jgi:hypothetical protein
MRTNRIGSTRGGFRNPLAGIFAGPIFAIIGLVMACFGWGSYSAVHTFIDKAEQAKGTVVDLVEKTSRDNDGNLKTYYYPVVEFTTAGGEKIRFQSSTGSYPAEKQVGETVEILYAADNPRDARPNSFTGLWLWPAVLLGMGGIFVLVGVGSFIQSLLFVAGLGGLAAALLFWKKKADDNKNNAPNGSS